MSAQASKELLKAHAVISRSWLLAQIEKNFRLEGKEEKQQSCYRDNEQLVRWYDRIASVTRESPAPPTRSSKR